MARRRRLRTAQEGSIISNREAMRILRSNVMVTLADVRQPVLIVTSAVAGEGKTATCAGLARSLTMANQRVVLVDLDLRHPDAHRWVGGQNESGVADVLLGRKTLQDTLQFVDTSVDGGVGSAGLYFLGTGSSVASPTELLGSERTADMLATLSTQADIVLIDTPPILPVADTLVIGGMAAGALLVVEAQRTPISAVKEAKDSLTRAQTRLFGVVLNKFVERRLGYGYAYGYGYGEPEPRLHPTRDVSSNGKARTTNEG